MPDQPSSRWKHDLKNQLGIALGFAELLLHDLPEDHPTRLDLEEIFNATENAMAIVDTVETPE